MGAKESIDHHVLLYGQQAHGKTNFLFDNFLNGKWTEEQKSVQSSLGYNYELVQVPNGQKYGVWDISGHQEFTDLQGVFMKTIPFSGILYILRPSYNNGILSDEKLRQIGAARKHIHYLTNHPIFNKKVIMIILNIDEDEEMQSEGIELAEETTDQIIEEIKELIKYDEIITPNKGICTIERGSYFKLWDKVTHLIEMSKKVETKVTADAASANQLDKLK